MYTCIPAAYIDFPRSPRQRCRALRSVAAGAACGFNVRPRCPVARLIFDAALLYDANTIAGGRGRPPTDREITENDNACRLSLSAAWHIYFLSVARRVHSRLRCYMSSNHPWSTFSFTPHVCTYVSLIISSLNVTTKRHFCRAVFTCATLC